MHKINWYLLKKSVLKQTSPEEEGRVCMWKGETEENRKYYERLSVFLNNPEKEPVDIEKNYHHFIRRIDRNLRLKIIRLTCYAAIITIFIGSGIFFFFPEKSLSGGMEKTEPILVGEFKAILYPGSGEPVVLGKENRKEVLVTKDFSLVQKNDVVNYAATALVCSRTETHTLQVPHGGEFQLCLSDGSHVFVNSESELKYPAVFTGDERRVVLTGEAYFQVTKSQKPFIVEVNGMEIKVLGTEFNVCAYPGEMEYETTLVQGMVEVNSKCGTVFLLPNEQAILTGKTSLTKRRVDADKYTAWKDGNVAFEDERLEDIMIRLARWYNINVFYTRSDLKDIRFTGNINRYGDIRILLEKIEKVNVVRFEIKENSITVIAR